jgi:hypothetical protein
MKYLSYWQFISFYSLPSEKWQRKRKWKKKEKKEATSLGGKTYKTTNSCFGQLLGDRRGGRLDFLPSKMNGDKLTHFCECLFSINIRHFVLFLFKGDCYCDDFQPFLFLLFDFLWLLRHTFIMCSNVGILLAAHASMPLLPFYKLIDGDWVEKSSANNSNFVRIAICGLSRSYSSLDALYYIRLRSVELLSPDPRRKHKVGIRK